MPSANGTKSPTVKQGNAPPPHDLPAGTRINIYYSGKHYEHRYYPATVVSNYVVYGGIVRLTPRCGTQPDHEGTRVYTHDLTKKRFYQKTPKPTRTTGIALSAVGTTTSDEQATRPVGRTGKLRAATSEVSPPLPPRAAPPPPSTEDEQVTGLAVGAIGELTPILPDNWRNRPSVRRHERNQRRRRRRRQRKPPPAAALINNNETPPVTTRAPTSTRAPTRPRRRWDGWEWIYDNLRS